MKTPSKKSNSREEEHAVASISRLIRSIGRSVKLEPLINETVALMDEHERIGKALENVMTELLDHQSSCTEAPP